MNHMLINQSFICHNTNFKFVYSFAYFLLLNLFSILLISQISRY